MKRARTRKTELQTATPSEDILVPTKRAKKRIKHETTPQERLLDEMTPSANDEAVPRKKKDKRGVVYVGRIPHGFYEAQMKDFFSQFGEVTRVRISRNKKTGKSRHHGWIEFEHRDIAEVVAETMNNYFIYGHLMKVVLIAPEDVHPKLFKGAGTRFKRVPRALVAAERHNRERTEEEEDRRLERLIAKEQKQRQKLKDLDIDYDFSGYEALRSKRKRGDDEPKIPKKQRKQEKKGMPKRSPVRTRSRVAHK